MDPVRQNPIQRTVSLFICVCIALCTIVVHNIAQNRPNSFPPYPPDNHHYSDDVYLREGGVATLICHKQLCRTVSTVWDTVKTYITPQTSYNKYYKTHALFRQSDNQSNVCLYSIGSVKVSAVPVPNMCSRKAMFYTVSQKKRPTFGLLYLWCTWMDLDIFWEKCYR